MKAAKAKMIPLVATVTSMDDDQPIEYRDDEVVEVYHYDFGTDVSLSESLFIDELVRLTAKSLDCKIRLGKDRLQYHLIT